jgi:hypothetical protein
MADPKRTAGLLDELARAWACTSPSTTSAPATPRCRRCSSSRSARSRSTSPSCATSATDENDATIVRTIIEMGRSLGMEVIAEGVETLDQFGFLRTAGCDFAQGQLFGEPCSADVLGELLSRQVHTGQSPFGAILPPAVTESTGTHAR